MRDKLVASKNIAEFVEFLKANDYKFSANQAVRAAEQLPLQSLDAFAKMQDGQAMLNPGPNGVQVLVVAGSRSEPVTEEQARPAIDQFLSNDRKRKLIEDDLKALRAAAKLEYVGKFGEAASAPTASQPVASPASAPSTKGAASAGLSGSDISKGMGLK